MFIVMYQLILRTVMTLIEYRPALSLGSIMFHEVTVYREKFS